MASTGWLDDLGDMAPSLMKLGISFGILFVILGAFYSALVTSSPEAANTVQLIMTSVSAGITTYFPLIITIVFLLIIYVVAMKATSQTGGRKHK